jgi:hypothetical protein
METEFKGTKGKWSFSSQRGTKNHCLQAQIWSDTKEEYVANINSTDEEFEANANAKLIALSPELLSNFISAIILLKQTTEFEVLESYRIKVLEFEKVLEKALT